MQQFQLGIALRPTGDDGKAMELKKDLFLKIVHNVVNNTEMRCVYFSQMAKVSGVAAAKAFGITKELRSATHPEIGGHKNMNIIVSKSTTQDCSDHEASENPGGTVAEHELLHIVLRNVRNDNFGGNQHKTEVGDFAKLHHQLMVLIHIAAQYETTLPPWSKPATKFVCGEAKADAAAPGADADKASKNAAEAAPSEEDKALNGDGVSTQTDTPPPPPPQ